MHDPRAENIEASPDKYGQDHMEAGLRLLSTKARKIPRWQQHDRSRGTCSDETHLPILKRLLGWVGNFPEKAAT